MRSGEPVSAVKFAVLGFREEQGNSARSDVMELGIHSFDQGRGGTLVGIQIVSSIRHSVWLQIQRIRETSVSLN
jgi:hypothetical protein